MHGEIAELRSRILGPVNSIPTTFTCDGEIDWPGVRKIIETGITGGSMISLLTVGDSQFDFLSDEEVAELTKVLVEQSAGRAVTVAATKRWWTGTALAFAHYCREIGVDMLMMLPSQHVVSATDLAGWYKAVAEVIPVMLVGKPTHEILDDLLDEPRICAFKEDGTLEYALETMTKYHSQWEFVTGGFYRRHLTQWPYGCRAFFSWTSSFAPHVAQRYWQALQQNDLDSATEVIVRVEVTFAQLARRNPEGWQATWRGAFELNGVAQRYLRPPRRSLNDAEMAELAAALDQIGLLANAA
jgi:dihydrodipicolinate synthase/N-acetylneuraminate lyase